MIGADTTYTAVDAGWGVPFVAAVLILAAFTWATIATVRLLAARIRARRTHELAPPRPLRIREVRR